MTEPTERQLRKLQRLLAEADELLVSMIETLTASNPARAHAIVPIVKPLPPAVDQTAWDAYQKHRRDIRAKKLSPDGLDRLAASFANYPPHVQLAAVDASIRNGWTGVFPEKVRDAPIGPVEIMKQRLQQWIAKSSAS